MALFGKSELTTSSRLGAVPPEFHSAQKHYKVSDGNYISRRRSRSLQRRTCKGTREKEGKGSCYKRFYSDAGICDRGRMFALRRGDQGFRFRLTSRFIHWCRAYPSVLGPGPFPSPARARRRPIFLRYFLQASLHSSASPLRGIRSLLQLVVS